MPRALRTSNAWVPQRQDIDNFYGTIAEAEFASLWDLRGRDPFEVWLDESIRKRHRPRIEFDGKPLEHYFSPGAATAPGHSLIRLVDGNSNKFADFAVKIDGEALLSGKKIQLKVERDFRASVVASAIKIAHLTMFRMLGYKYALSPPGIYIGSILAEFFHLYSKRPRSELSNALSQFFGKFACMVSPMENVDDSVFQGTISDNRIFVCEGASHGPFAIGVVVRVVKDMICVFLPPDHAKGLETYLSFLKEPPGSIATRTMQFQPEIRDEDSHWITSAEDPVRVPLPFGLPNGLG